MGIFNENGLFNRGFSFLGQLIGLNLLWMICTLPVFTAGASTTAMSCCTLKLHKYGECNIWKDFFRSFKRNFRQSTVIWIGMLTMAGLLYVESKAVLTMPGNFSGIFSCLLAAVCIPFAMTALYVFPTLAAFENTTKKIIANAFYFSVKNVGRTLVIAAVTFLPMFFTLVDAKLFPVYLFFWLVCGFSLTAYADTWFLWKLFKTYYQEEETENGDTDLYYF